MLKPVLNCSSELRHDLFFSIQLLAFLIMKPRVFSDHTGNRGVGGSLQTMFCHQTLLCSVGESYF